MNPPHTGSVIDTRPFDWEHPDSERLLTLLVNAYPNQKKATHRLKVSGVALDEINTSQAIKGFWTDTLEEASQQRKLRRMVEKILEDGSVRGYHEDFQALAQCAASGTAPEEPAEFPAAPPGPVQASGGGAPGSGSGRDPGLSTSPSGPWLEASLLTGIGDAFITGGYTHKPMIEALLSPVPSGAKYLPFITDSQDPSVGFRFMLHELNRTPASPEGLVPLVALLRSAEQNTASDEARQVFADALGLLRGEAPSTPLQSAQDEGSKPDLSDPALDHIYNTVETEGGLEKLTSKGDPFLNPGHLARWLTRVERQICQVRCGQEHGTGFLVGPDLVLTCYHVVKDLFKGWVTVNGVKVRFDYRLGEDGTAPDYKSFGQWIGLDESFEIPHSPYSQKADVKLEGDPGPNELDFALLKLDQEVGRQRGWLDLSEDLSLPPEGSPVLIVQHPGNGGDPDKPPQAPLKLTFATPGFVGKNANDTRVIYKPSTLPGSSGSPVFDGRLRPFALHHNRGQIDKRVKDSKRALNNRGIPLAKIRAALPLVLRAGLEPPLQGLQPPAKRDKPREETLAMDRGLALEMLQETLPAIFELVRFDLGISSSLLSGPQATKAIRIIELVAQRDPSLGELEKVLRKRLGDHHLWKGPD